MNDEIAEKTYSISFRQEEVSYNTVSPLTGDEQCANCRWFNPTDSYGASCRIVEPYPDAILATGYCSEWVERPNLNESLMEDMMEGFGEEKMLYITPKPLKRGFISRLFNQDKSRTLFARDSEGARIGIHVTSNGYEDRDIEHVAQAALAQYAEACFKTADNGDVEWAGDNRLLFWHRPMLDMGDIFYAKMYDGFLVELSRERDTPIARKLWDYWERTSKDGSVLWATSQGFKPVKMSVQEDKLVYDEIRKKETSILPLHAASNQLTISEVLRYGKIN